MPVRARPWLIAGPTASGKSGLALGLARELGGIVINADSMQVYQDLRILTARPSAEDELQAPHALYGFVPGAEAYSAGRFVADAGHAIAEARAAGRVPILVGGTGLYFKALLQGLSPIPSIPPEIRGHWRKEADERGSLELHSVLAGRDPETAARLAPADRQRIVRALEVLAATGRTISDWQRERGAPVLTDADTVRLVVTLDRAELYARCESRFDGMMAAGAMEEVAALAGQRLDLALPIMRALGVRPLLGYTRGELSKDDAIIRAKGETRHYAKRQLTWARSHMPDWTWISESDPRALLNAALGL